MDPTHQAGWGAHALALSNIVIIMMGMRRTFIVTNIEYVYCQEEGRSSATTETDLPRPQRNLVIGGDVQPNTSRLEAVYGNSLIINPSLQLLLS